MAKMEQYIFNVDAKTDQAVAKLREIDKLMNDIEQVRNRGVNDYDTTNQKDMDRSMRSVAQLTALYKSLNNELSDLQRQMRTVAETTPIPKDGTKEQIEGIRRVKAAAQDQANAALRQQRMLQAAYYKTVETHRESVTFQQNSSKNFKSIFNSNDLRNLPGDDTRAKNVVESITSNIDEVTKRINGVSSKIQEVNKLDRRAESMSRRAEASGYMSYQQATSFKSDYRTGTEDYSAEKQANVDELTSLGQQRSRLHTEVKQIESLDDPNPKQINRKVALQENIAAIDDEWEKRIELNRVLDRTINNMKEYGSRLNDNLEVKPERGTFQGMIYERAPAIGLALTAAVGAAVGGLYHRGAGVNDAMRDDTISIGQRTDMAGEDWRSGVRDNAFSLGMEDRLGFSGQEMLAFQNNYLSNAGFEGVEDLNTAAQSQAQFSRVSGVDANASRQFFDAVYSTGAVNGAQTKDIQNAFVGAIKNSGMEGREQDQISALEGILGSVKQGRSMTNEEVMSVMGLQSVLAGSGNRALSGSSGGELLQGLNEGIRQGFNNPMVRLAFGQGSEYQGLEGRFALRQRMDEGITNSRNVTDIAKLAESYMPGSEAGQNEVFASFVQEGLGTDITAEQAEGLMDLYRQGALTEENIGNVIQNDQATGAATAEERLREYQESAAATENQSAAVTDKQAANIYDLGDPIRELNSTMGGLHAPIYGLILAIGALTVAVGGSGLSFGMSRGVRRGAASSFGKVKPKNSTNTTTGANPSVWQRGKDTVGGWFGRGSDPKNGEPMKPSAWQRTKDTVGGWFNRKPPGGGGTPPTPPNAPNTPPPGGGGTPNAPGGAGGAGAAAGEAAEGAAAGASRAGGWLGKAGNVLGKAALPLAALFGIGSVINAPEGEKAEAAGSAIGGIGAGIAGGAAAGAALGTIVPGVGNVVGGIGGGIVGGIAGSKLGGWIGSQFGATKAEASELTPEEAAANLPEDAAVNDTPNANEVEKQVERENTTRKDQAENKRSDNISAERENLVRYEAILERSAQLLQQAAAQGGIFGAGQSVGANTATGEAAAQLSGDGTAEKVWNFFSQKGFTPESISGVMGNLMQESQLDPNAVNPTSGAYGIGQWLGGRKTNLENYAKDQGKPVNDLGTQLEFLWKELNGGDSTTKSILDKNGGIDALKGSTDIQGVTNLFEKAFERSGGSEMGKRYDYAKDIYGQYGTQAQNSTDVTASATKAAATSNTAKVTSTINVNVRGDESVADKVNNSKEMNNVAQKIQQSIYGSMDFFSKEMRMV